MRSSRIFRCFVLGFFLSGALGAVAGAANLIPDGRAITPIGWTIPVEGFASSEALSPDGKFIAALSQQGGAVDIVSLGEDSRLVGRLAVPFASGMTWTSDGLYVTRGYAGAVARFTYALGDSGLPVMAARTEIDLGGLLNGIAEDPSTHRIAVAKTASHEVDVIDDQSGEIQTHLSASGQPFSVGFAGSMLVATIYNSDHIDAWSSGAAAAHVLTGAHPTRMLVANGNIYVADADGHEVVKIDASALRVVQRYDLGTGMKGLTGQTPSGMAISNDGTRLFVAESGFNDVAVVNTAEGHVEARIPSGWYPTDVAFVAGATIAKDPRTKDQLYILSGQGLGTQPNPGGEWNGWYTGFVQHVVVEPNQFARWTATVSSNNHFSRFNEPSATGLPGIKHIVFIVRENKHFDEYFGDEPRANSDPALLVYGRKYTPNSHALAERYTMFDNFMANGEKSDFGHSWTTQGIANDYLERNGNTPEDAAAGSDPRVASSIWPRPLFGEDKVPISVMNFDWFASLSALPSQPRINVSAVFGPRGELIDELSRARVPFRVYGEQMTMLPDGSIAPGLAAHADTSYPGAHIDFDVLDTERARLFLQDVRAHGLCPYSYLTVPTDHTAGTRAGFYTPASYVASNDLAVGQIIAGLSKRPEWKSTIVFVTEDDAQGTGDHVDSHRMPAFMVGPYVRRGFVDHTRYSYPSFLRTVEVIFGLQPLNIEDALAAPMIDALAREPETAEYSALPANIPMEKNPGKPKTTSLRVDGAESSDIPNQEWASIHGAASLPAHLAYLRRLGVAPQVASDDDR